MTDGLERANLFREYKTVKVRRGFLKGETTKETNKQTNLEGFVTMTTTNWTSSMPLVIGLVLNTIWNLDQDT
jgi:hypothetical protein